MKQFHVAALICLGVVIFPGHSYAQGAQVRPGMVGGTPKLAEVHPPRKSAWLIIRSAGLGPK